MAGGNPRPPALDDNPGILAYFKSTALPVLPAPSFYRNHMMQREWGWLRRATWEGGGGGEGRLAEGWGGGDRGGVRK